MKIDDFGKSYLTSAELCDVLYQNPKFDTGACYIEDPDEHNNSVASLYSELNKLSTYIKPEMSVEQFDARNQSTWFMPMKYQELDIAEWVLHQCNTQDELQRVGMELLLYQERDLLNLLRYIKYMVDTMRENNILWGVGRGSSVSSYVLYKIGIHRIDSMYYGLNIEEFLR